MEMKVWKDIDGTDGLYQVNNTGEVRSVKSGKLMKPFDNGHGYMVVSLSLKNGRKNIYVHRAVASAFLKKEKGRVNVNHIDYNTKNNCVENLEWCTQAENIAYSAWRMKGQRISVSSGKLGIPYISPKMNKYRVCISVKKIDKCFARLEDAIRFRNEVLNEIGYTV